MVRRTSWAKHRYFLNYCCFGYSLPWWDWEQWERLIDWMALRGITAPLAVTGQEAVWQAVGRRLGLSDGQMRAFLAGPPYLPFGWMGCLDGWGGLVVRRPRAAGHRRSRGRRRLLRRPPNLRLHRRGIPRRRGVGTGRRSTRQRGAIHRARVHLLLQASSGALPARHPDAQLGEHRPAPRRGDGIPRMRRRG
ncbi:MAG: hypothetical protein GY711_34025 [bacterium]|nr:hypothetical protein [bacterium]